MSIYESICYILMNLSSRTSATSKHSDQRVRRNPDYTDEDAQRTELHAEHQESSIRRDDRSKLGAVDLLRHM